MVSQFDFDHLIAPLDATDFFAHYWEKKPLLLKNRDQSYYAQLGAIADIDAILNFSRLKPPEIRVVKNQQELLPSTYINTDGSFNLNQLYKAYQEGHTLIINGLQQFWQPLATLCQTLQADLNHLIIANLYLSPKSSKGLKPHFDTHDVFVLQVEGSKQWHVHHPSQVTPLLGSFQPIFSEEHLGEPIESVRLEAGDLLYIPRGFVHHAETTETSSLHLTLGIYPAQWFDLIVTALTAVSMKDERFRKALPIGFLDQEDLKSSLKTQMYDLIEHLMNNFQIDEVMQMMEDRFIRQIPQIPDGQFAQIDALDQVHLNSTIVKRSGMRCRIIPKGFNVSIQFPGNTIKGLSYIEPALRFIADTETFVVQELPDVLTDEAKVTLVQRLIRGGLLKVANGLLHE